MAAAIQQLLFPDPRPLVERLGREFFVSLPEAPGVYLMRDDRGVPLYIGKAKNLRQRLRAYRVANPGRMKRRHLRLLGSAAAIDIELCADEDSALAREAELILLHRPRFNRAGTWPIARRYVAWQIAEGAVEVRVTELPPDEWRVLGPVGSGAARRYRSALMRLLWIAAHPGSSMDEMPWGWIHGRMPEGARADLNGGEERFGIIVQAWMEGCVEPLAIAVRSAVGEAPPGFVAELIEKDLERLARLAAGSASVPENPTAPSLVPMDSSGTG